MTIAALFDLHCKYFNISAWLRPHDGGVHCGNEAATGSNQNDKLPSDVRMMPITLRRVVSLLAINIPLAAHVALIQILPHSLWRLTS